MHQKGRDHADRCLRSCENCIGIDVGQEVAVQVGMGESRERKAGVRYSCRDHLRVWRQIIVRQLGEVPLLSDAKTWTAEMEHNPALVDVET